MFIRNLMIYFLALGSAFAGGNDQSEDVAKVNGNAEAIMPAVEEGAVVAPISMVVAEEAPAVVPSVVSKPEEGVTVKPAVDPEPKWGYTYVAAPCLTLSFNDDHSPVTYLISKKEDKKPQSPRRLSGPES